MANGPWSGLYARGGARSLTTAAAKWPRSSAARSIVESALFGDAPVATVYAVIGPDAGWSDPTAAEVIAGTLAGGGAATWAGNYPAPTVDGTYDWPSAATGLTASTAYRIAIVWSDGNTPSNVAVGSFSSASSGAASGDGSSSITFAVSGQGRSLRAAVGSSSVTFAVSAQGASRRSGAGNSSLTFAGSAQGASRRSGAGSSSLTFSASGVGAIGGNTSGAGSSSVTFAATGQGASRRSGAGSSSVTFAATGTGGATKPATGTASITFSATGEGATSSSNQGAGSSSITFAATGAGASIRAATGSASITFGAQGVATAPAVEAATVTQAGGSTQRKRRRYILPDDTEVLATDVEIRDILRAFVKPKPQPTKRGKVARVVPLAEQVTFEPDETQQVERIVLRLELATWQPDRQLFEAMVRDIVVRRRRRTVELLLMAA